MINNNINKKFLGGYSMSKRLTIMLDDDLDRKLRILQAKMIQKNQGSYSFSRAVNDSLRKTLK